MEEIVHTIEQSILSRARTQMRHLQVKIPRCAEDGYPCSSIYTDLVVSR